MTIQPVYIPFNKKGFSNKKCYLAGTKGCSQKISREHYISKNLLDKIEKYNATIDVCGLSWLPKEHLKSIGKSSLVANILCTQHNSDLSGLDSELGNFVEAISLIDKEFQNENPSSLIYSIDGTYIERWLLKSLVGMVESRQIKQKNGIPFQYKKKCIKLICSNQERWPAGWGLYVSKPLNRVYHSSSIEFIPMHNPNNGELLAATVKISGIEMNFLMGKPNSSTVYGIQRPKTITFEKNGVKSAINLNWGKHKVGLEIGYTQVGVYSGLAPSHNLPRLD